MTFHPVFDGAANQHLLLLGKLIRSNPTGVLGTSSRPESSCEILPIAVNPPEIHIQHVVAVHR